MSRGCASTSEIYCRANARTPRPPATLVQCCWPFRAWRSIEGVPLGQLHSHSHNLPEHLGFLRVPQDSNRNRRQGMGLQNHFFATHAAPAASVALAGFYKIDGTLVFRAPGAFHHLILGLVDLYKTARRKNRIHGEILGADIAISEIGVGKLREVGDRNQSPLLDHATQVRSAAFVK